MLVPWDFTHTFLRSRMLTRRYRLLAPLLVGVLLAGTGCSLLDADESIDPVQEELDRNVDRWRAQEVDSYIYNYTRSCQCASWESGAFRVYVRDGLIASVDPADDLIITDPQQAARFFSVFRLFQLVQEAIDADAHLIDVEYESTMGYPTRIRIEYQPGDEAAPEAIDVTSLRLPIAQHSP